MDLLADSVKTQAFSRIFLFDRRLVKNQRIHYYIVTSAGIV